MDLRALVHVRGTGALPPRRRSAWPESTADVTRTPAIAANRLLTPRRWASLSQLHRPTWRMDWRRAREASESRPRATTSELLVSDEASSQPATGASSWSD